MHDSRTLAQECMRRARAASLHVDCLGEGNINAEVAIVAEAPGEAETRLHIPLVGNSGKFIWERLRKYGITRQKVFVTNVIKRQLVVTNEPIKKRVPAQELDHWTSLLLWELSQLPNLKYILVLGGVALTALTGREGVDAWRGSVFTLDSREHKRKLQYVITYNPAYVMRVPALELMFRLDLHKLHMAATGVYREHKITPIINPSVSDSVAFIRRMRAERKPVSFDIETIARETACVGLANNAHEGMCINFRDTHGNRYTLPDEIRIRQELAALFADTSVQFIAQNGNFDSYWLWYKDRIRVRRVHFDTLLAHHVLYPLLPHGLDFLVAQYTTHPYYKNERTDWKESADGNIDQFWEYNVKDACLTHAVHTALAKELKDQNLEGIFHSHIMHANKWLTQMTVVGVLVDEDRRKQFNHDYGLLVDKRLDEFHAAVAQATQEFNYRPNPLSRKDMQNLLFGKLRLVGHGLSTDETNRIHMLANPRTRDEDKEVLIKLSRYKKEQKFHSTYTVARADEDSRIRTEYKQFGTRLAPGRLSSAKNLWGSGMNMQNQPPKAREFYIADDGYTFVYFDLAQAEARFVAWDARIIKWKEQFERARIDGSYDCHCALASEMFKMPYELVPKKDVDSATGEYTIRYKSKRCRHGLNYRMQPFRLSEVTGLPYVECVKLHGIYHALTPELRVWWRELEDEVRSTGRLYTPYGRRLIIMGRIETDDQLESIVAFRPQSTIGDKNVQVTYQAQEDDKWPHDARIVLNVHDSLTAIAPIRKVKTCAAIMKRYAELPIMVKGEPMIVPAETKWVDPSKSTDGMRRWSDLVTLEL